MTPVTVPFPIRHELVPLCQHLAQRFIGSVNPVATSNDARAIAQLDQPIWMIDAVQIVQTQSNREFVITGEHAINAGILAAVLKEHDRELPLVHFSGRGYEPGTIVINRPVVLVTAAAPMIRGGPSRFSVVSLCPLSSLPGSSCGHSPIRIEPPRTPITMSPAAVRRFANTTRRDHSGAHNHLSHHQQTL